MSVPGRNGAADGWVADPSITWRILLTADLVAPPHPHDVRTALAALYAAQGWAGVGSVVTGDDVEALRRSLGEVPGAGLVVGLAGPTIVVSAHHSRVDGLGLLAVLTALTGGLVSSSARGVADRPSGSGFVGTVGRRLLEVAAAPPARIAGSQRSTHARGDVYLATDVPGEHRTSDLVHAAAGAVVAHNGARRTRHVAIAVGVSRAGGDQTQIADRSALLRLRDVERLDRQDVRAALAVAPTQHLGGTSAGSGGGAVMRLGLKALAPRLGSTLLVSHLGTVSAPGVDHLAFHPVTAGGTGLSLGAVTLGQVGPVGASTTITLRGRGRSWTRDGLEHLLEAITRELRQQR